MTRAVVDLSRLWLEANPTAWFVTLDAARAGGRTLLEVIRDRYLAVRDELAREAFDRQTTVAVVARERLAELVETRKLGGGKGGMVLSHEIIEAGIGIGQGERKSVPP